MSDIQKILETVQDIQASLVILPEIQTRLAKLSDAVKAHMSATAHLVPSSFVLPDVSLTVDSELVEESINDVENKFSKNEKENGQGVSKRENQERYAESADKTKKKLTLSEKKKLRKLKKKQAIQLNPGKSSSNELDVKPTPEIQPPQAQDQRSTKEVAPLRVTARPPSRGPLRLHVSYF
jgi:hypothetical protein